MANPPQAPHVDMQTVTDDMAGLYEAIATLEYSGREPSRAAIADVTGLPDQLLDDNLASMSSLGMLVVEDHGGESVYIPARRGWSAAPDQAEGHKLA
jgi:hypothetical protein